MGADRGGYFEHGTNLWKLQSRKEADKLIGFMAKMYHKRRFGHSDEKPVDTVRMVYGTFYSSHNREREELGWVHRPDFIRQSFLVGVFKEMGVIYPPTKGRARYRMTVFEDWRAVIDSKKFLRVSHFHDDGTAYRVCKFEMKDGTKTPTGWKCVDCKEPEPLRVKGFCLLQTIGSTP